jgi:hypothetical protein
MTIRLPILLAAFAAPVLAQPVTLRVATFNIEDVRTTDLKDADQPRLKRIAGVIQHLRPNMILLNEIAYDQPGVPGFVEGEKPGQNAQRFADLYLGTAQGEGLMPLRYKAFTAPVNTGVPSGFDLDNDGAIVTSYPAPPAALPDGRHPQPSDAARQYGNDCWGFGTFPGQYGMALLVDERLEILHEQVRTFQRLPWEYIAGAFLPEGEEGSPWYSEEERRLMRLSSKSHWDVPIRLPGGAVVHLLCSHPTPPAFDGPEGRNRKRNHDEIRFWIDYLENQPSLVDDAGRQGGLEPGESFIILGDLNADPARGESFKNPIRKLASAPRVNASITPLADLDVAGIPDSATAMFGLCVDYVLPSSDLEVGRSGVWRAVPRGGVTFPSDHFPVWMELTVPPK